jgi:predicted nuclease of predicted toxin-antitoxin system
LKLLLDRCVSPRTGEALRATGHDALWVGDWDSDPGDATVLDFAHRESRILITLDKDFGELAVAFGQPHCGIVRLVDIHPRDQASACKSVLAKYGDDLAAGAIVTLARGRIRLRPSDPQ